MPLTLGTCMSRACAAAREYTLCYPGRGHPHANAFSLEPSFLEESLTPTAHVNAGRPRTVRTLATQDTTIAAVEREPWRSENSGYPN
jgi:hypothetical protein